MWFRNKSNITFVLAKMAEKNISVDLYIEINAYLSTSAYFNGQSISVPIAAINDIREIESVLQELALKYNSSSDNTKESIHCLEPKSILRMSSMIYYLIMNIIMILQN